MKYIGIISLLLGLELSADYVKKTIAVCSDKDKVFELREFAKKENIDKGGVEVELWLMNHECRVIDNKTRIEVLEYKGKEQEVLKLLLKDSGDIVYAPNRGIQIEQPGQKDIIYKF